MGFESLNPSELELKILNSYKNQTKIDGKANQKDYKYAVQHNAATNKTIIREQDNDTFLTELDDSGNYVTRLVDEDELTEIMLEDSSFENEIAQTSYVAPKSTKQVEHKAGTGSTKERVDALSKLVKRSEINQFQNENGVSRNDIQKWLDDNGLSENTSVDGGFNVDDVLQYYSNNSSGTYEIYYHLLANEAWIGKNADGNNKVDGKISQTEVKNFVKERFGVDVTKTEFVQKEEFNQWKEANIAVGSEFHQKFSLDDMRKFVNYYYDYPSPDSDNNSSNSNNNNNNNNRYDDDDDYRYTSTLYSSSLDTASEVKNLLNNLKEEGDYNAKFTMNKNVNVYDNYGDKIKLANGETYEILDVSSSYVTIDVDGEKIKVKRGTTSSTKGFEYLCQNAIKKAIINADTKFSSSATTNNNNSNDDNDDDYRYDTTLSSSKLDSTTEIKNTLDNLKSTAEYSASIEMKDDVKVYDEYGDKITLSDGETYDIVNVEKSYITLDVDGEEIRIKRGTTSSSKGFEYLCQKAIEEAKINADERITNSAKSSSYTYSRTISSSSLDTKNEVKNVLNNLQDAEKYKASIYFEDDIKMYDEFTNKNVNFDSDEAYSIVKVTDDYVYLDVDGTNVKIERGSSSSQFEAKCADMINKITYSANEIISTTSSSSNSSSSINGTKYTNVSLANYKPEQVSNILDNIQDDDMEASIVISNKYWFDEDSSPYVPVGEYEITKVTNSYVIMENEDGEEYKIPRGDDEEYTFEWYASKENKQGSITRITTDY